MEREGDGQRLRHVGAPIQCEVKDTRIAHRRNAVSFQGALQGEVSNAPLPCQRLERGILAFKLREYAGANDGLDLTANRILRHLDRQKSFANQRAHGACRCVEVPLHLGKSQATVILSPDKRAYLLDVHRQRAETLHSLAQPDVSKPPIDDQLYDLRQRTTCPFRRRRDVGAAFGDRQAAIDCLQQRGPEGIEVDAAISNAVPVVAAPIAIACGCLVGFVTLCFFPLHVLAATLLGEAAALGAVFRILPKAKGLLIGIAWAVRLGSDAEMPDLHSAVCDFSTPS